MALTRRDDGWFGGGPEDIRPVLDGLARDHGGAVSHYADAVCPCGGREFGIVVAEGRGCATLDCEACGARLSTGPVPADAGDAGAEACNCACGGDCFEVCAAVVRSPGRAPRRFFLAARCTGCGRVAGYGEWAVPPRVRPPAWRAG
jgi:hypothetical protein